MGNDSSTAIKNESNTLITDTTHIETLNQSMNKVMSETTINMANVCSNNVAGLQQIELKNINVKGDLNINLKQNQSVVVTFSCLNVSDVVNQVNNDLVNSMMQQIESINNTDILQQLDANASTSQSAGFGGGINSAKTKQNQTTNYTQNTSRYENLQTLVQNVVETNFTTDIANKCLNSVNESNNAQATDIYVGGNAIIAIDQEQAVTTYTECVNKSNISNNVTTQLLNALQIKVATTSTSVVKQEATATSKTEQTAQMNPFASSSSSSYSCCCFAIILVLGVVAVVMMKAAKGGKGGDDGGDE